MWIYSILHIAWPKSGVAFSHIGSGCNVGKCHSNTILIIIAFPWLRDVPEVISSGTWGQKDPAGSPIASDSAHLPDFSHTTSTTPVDYT